jgi:broad specificity phosphatase PhoE
MLRARETLAGVLQGYAGAAPGRPPPSRSPPPGSPLLPLVEYGEALRERAKGALEGRRNDLTLEEAEELRLKEGGGEVKLETEEQLRERLRGFVEGVLEGVKGQDAKGQDAKVQDAKVLVVTHGGCLRAFLKGVFKVVPDDATVRVFNGSTTVVQVELAEGAGGAGGEGWKATLFGPVGDISFIPAELVTQRSDW